VSETILALAARLGTDTTAAAPADTSLPVARMVAAG
jgi:hypothetical protein